MLRSHFLVVLMAALVATPAQAQVYTADGAPGHNYKVQFLAPYKCYLMMTTPRGGIFSLTRNSNVPGGRFRYTRVGFPKLPSGANKPNTQIWLEFSGAGAKNEVSVAAQGIALNNNINGFDFPFDPKMQQDFGKASSVRITFGDSKRTEIDAVDLKGSSRALAALETCAGQSSEASAKAAVTNAQTPPMPKAEPTGKVTTRWLTGVWVFEGDHCAGDSGLQFNAGGEYVAYGVYGSWSLSGDTLTLKLQELEDDGPVGKRKTNITKVAYVNQNEAVLWSGRVRRCPEGMNQKEPWFPREKFNETY